MLKTTCPFHYHRRNHWTNLFREGRIHSLTRYLHLPELLSLRHVESTLKPVFHFESSSNAIELISPHFLCCYFAHSWSAPWVPWQSTACHPSSGLCSTGTRDKTAWRTSRTSTDPEPTPSRKSEVKSGSELKAAPITEHIDKENNMFFFFVSGVVMSNRRTTYWSGEIWQ